MFFRAVTKLSELPLLPCMPTLKNRLNYYGCYCGLPSIIRSFSQTPRLYRLNKKISNLIRSGRLSEARALFDSMNERKIIDWNSMINGYVQQREMAKARPLFDEMLERDIVSWNLMISGYISCHFSRYIEKGRKLFDQMLERDCVSWNTMITGYAKNRWMDEALKLLNRMPERTLCHGMLLLLDFY